MQTRQTNRLLIWVMCCLLCVALFALPTSADIAESIGEGIGEGISEALPTEDIEAIKASVMDIANMVLNIHSMEDANETLAAFPQATLLIVAGVALLFALFGYRLFRLAIFAGGFGAGWFGATIAFDWLQKMGIVPATENLEMYIPLIVYGVAGLIVGMIVLKLFRTGVFLAAGLGTFFFLNGFPLFNELVDKIYAEEMDIKYLVARVLVSVIVGWLAIRLTRPVLIISTSAAGGMVAGISAMVALGQTENLTIETVVALVLAALGLVVQFRSDKEGKKKEK